MMNRKNRRTLRDRGSATLEVMILTPVIFILSDIGLYAGQMRMAHSMVRSAAQQAARSATIQRDTFYAHFYSDGTAGGVSSAQGMQCGSASQVPIKGWTNIDDPFQSTPPGQLASVTYRLTCFVPIRLIGMLGTAKYTAITEYATSVIDPYRYRQ